MPIPEISVAPTVHLVRISDIKQSPWNPSRRVSERRLTDLRISMDDLGLYYPVLIDQKKNLIDGHRRLAVAKSFGWQRIPAITIDHPLDESYGSVQLTQQKLSGNDILGVYLIEPKALSGSQRCRIARADKKLGRWSIKAIYDAGMSIATYDNAIRVSNYVEEALDLADILRWIIEHRMNVVWTLMRGEMPAKNILDAIRNDEPIRIS